MRRSRKVDWLVIATLLPLFLVMLAGGIQAYLATGGRILPFRLSGAQGADGYPIVLTLRAPQPDLEPGDRVLRVGEIDLRGLTNPEIRYRTHGLLREGRPFAVEGERGDTRFHTEVEPAPVPYWWWPFPSWVAFVLAGSFILIRAPHWHLARVFFLAVVAWACFGVSAGPTHPVEKAIGSVLAFPLAEALTLYVYLCWTESGRPGRGGIAAAWAIGVASAAIQAACFLLTLPTGSATGTLTAAVTVAFLVLVSAALVRTYRRSQPLERRQLRWILYTSFIGMLPIALTYITAALVPRLDERFFALGWCLVGVVPIGYAVAIVGHGWLDIDRVISATTAYTTVLIALVVTGLLLIPQVAGMLAQRIHVDERFVLTAIALGAGALVVPARRRIGPLVDRLFFRERQSLLEGFDKLLAEVSRYESLEDLAVCVGERLQALLQPQACAIYGRSGESFSPIFVRGRAVPDDIAGNGPLAAALEREQKPVELGQWRTPASPVRLTDLENEALDRLRTAVLLPIHRRAALVGFITIGDKRSGDIYTQTDLALLGAVADKVSTLLLRFDDTKLASIGAEMATMMHDLKNPLTVAMGCAELLAGAQSDQEREKVSRLIFRQFDLMQRMASDVLSYARGDSGLLVGKVLTRQFLKTLRAQLEPELGKRSLALVIDAEDSGVAYFDEAQMIRAISNLAYNAAEAMAETFRVKTHDGSGSLVIECVDDGPGIPPELQARLFTAFATAGKEGGTGLGLASVKKIVDAHGGTIEVSSVQGEGTTFRIELPLDRVYR